MDLFADKYYELDSLNKINYYNVLYGTLSVDIGTHTQVGTDDIIAQNINTVLLTTTTDHIQKDNSLMCYEVQITDTIKKIILE